MIFGRRKPPAAAPGPRVERVDRDLLRVVAPDGRAVVFGCESYEGVLSIWLPPGLRWGGGAVITDDERASIEAQVAGWATADGYTVSVNRS